MRRLCAHPSIGKCGLPSGFDRRVANSQMFLCQTVGWPLSAVTRGEESPGSTEARCRVTPGGGDPRESATENKPPRRPGSGRTARVKRCGKSAPRRRQRRRHGKPHREQDQVGAAGLPPCAVSQAYLRAAARVGRTRRPATGVPEEWPSPPGTPDGTEPGLHAVWHFSNNCGTCI